MTYEQAIIRGIGTGLFFAALLIGYIFVSGQTFGQRCAKMHPHGDDATIARCVNQLKHQI